MPADTRPTVDFGRRTGANSPDKVKAAADLRAGQARAAADERADAYRAAMKRTTPARQGYGARTRRRRTNPSPTNVGPAHDQFRDVEY